MARKRRLAKARKYNDEYRAYLSARGKAVWAQAGNEERRARLSAKGKAAWARKTPAEKQAHYDGIRIRTMLLNPAMALWPERWIADAMVPEGR